MNNEFIPYAEALALTELGFNEPCFATIDQTEFIHIKGTKYPIRGAMVYLDIDAPLYQQAFRWLYKQLGRDGFGLMPIDVDKCNRELRQLIEIVKNER